MFKFTSTFIDGLTVVQPSVHSDNRGVFFETFKATDFFMGGLPSIFSQDNYSESYKGVLRGLHFQKGSFAQGKLIRVIRGSVWDVAVDMRKSSRTYCKWYGLELNEENKTMFYVPPGFAHGFITLSDIACFSYKCTNEYNKNYEFGIRWDDPDLDIKWADVGIAPILSDKDKILPYVRDLKWNG